MMLISIHLLETLERNRSDVPPIQAGFSKVPKSFQTRKTITKISNPKFSERAVPGGGGGESNFPYILLNEIQTMFSQLAKQSSRP